MIRRDNISIGFPDRNHHSHKDLCEEHPYGDTGQIIALILFLIVWSLDSFIFRFSTIPANYLPLMVKLLLSAFSFLFAIYLSLKAHRAVFGEYNEPPGVIDTGVFSIVRHPLYLSALLFYLGFIFTTFSLSCFFLFGMIFLFYDHIASFEEKRLREKFGEIYARYSKKTPKWLPRPRFRK